MTTQRVSVNDFKKATRINYRVKCGQTYFKVSKKEILNSITLDKIIAVDIFSTMNTVFIVDTYNS